MTKEEKDTIVKNALEEKSQELLNKSFKDLTRDENFMVTTIVTKDFIEANKVDKIDDANEKKVYYFSAEFLIGKLLSNNLINLGIYDSVKEALKDTNYQMTDLEERENEPSLGNGGLGRLAACFLDSLATLGINAEGIGLRYRKGFVKQGIGSNPDDKETYLKQIDLSDPWIDTNSWAVRQDESYNVRLGNDMVKSSKYVIDVTGYNNGNSIKLNLFDLDSVDESIEQPNSINFDLKDIKKNLTLHLYPDDSTIAGQKLRIYQEYFMASNGDQMIVNRLKNANIDLRDMGKHVAIQINDTHPSLVIPELIRILIKENGLTMDEAINVVTNTCAYTNHTIMAEALEKWPVSYLEEVVPEIMPVIRELDKKAKEKYGDNDGINIITKIYDYNQQKEVEYVRMAYMDIIYSHSVNGVAKLHTEILKNTELNQFYKLFPEKFNNKTNGITFRRWLIKCNPELTGFINELIGDEWQYDASKLKDLEMFRDDESVLNRLMEIKHEKKVQFSNYEYEKNGILLDPNGFNDVQVKRAHEYKRQPMDYLHAVQKYLEIKYDDVKPEKPLNILFGCKAAPAYREAKEVIHSIAVLQEIIKNDKEVNPYLNVQMLENYNIELAEHVIPAADLSEQISLASKEASGTGNMKLMLNGALTIGTDDGANVEIHELVGDDNIYTFGMDSETVINLLQHKDNRWYNAYEEVRNNQNLQRIQNHLDFMKNASLDRIVHDKDYDESKDRHIHLGDYQALDHIEDRTMRQDPFMGLKDYNSGKNDNGTNYNGYCETKERAYNDYCTDEKKWAQKVLNQIANAGYFSSDRTIEQYNDEIWGATKHDYKKQSSIIVPDHSIALPKQKVLKITK